MILNKETQLKELKQNLKNKAQKENININKNNVIVNKRIMNNIKSEKRDKSKIPNVYNQLNTSGDLTDKDNLNSKNSLKNLIPSNLNSKKRDVRILFKLTSLDFDEPKASSNNETSQEPSQSKHLRFRQRESKRQI